MKLLYKLLLVPLLSCVLFLGCSSESDPPDSANSNEIILGKIVLTDGWARPGAEGHNSAAYVTISNGTAMTDTLLNTSSEAANSAEIHESVENDDGTTSMQPAGQQVVGDGNKLELAPGGIHIMLIDLKRELAVGDSISVSLEFSRVGSRTIKVPVQTSN